MKNSKIARLILTPSTFSLFATVGCSLFILLAAGFSYASNTGLFYDYLFGSDSSTKLIEESQSTLALFNDTVFGNPLLNKILFLIFWMVVGLVVYLLITGIGAGANSAEEIIEQSKYVHAQTGQIHKEAEIKLAIRLVAIGLLVIFGAVFIKVLLPFSILCARIVASNIHDPLGWLYAVLGFIVLGCSFYLMTVGIRVVALKPRVFGGSEDLIQDEVEHSAHKI